VPVPYFHIFGALGCITANTLAGSTQVLMETFEPEDAMRLIQAERVTVFSGVPTMFITILGHPTFGQYDLRSLRTGTIGAAPVPMEMMRKILDREHGLGMNATVVYGLTEATGGTHFTRRGDPIEQRVSTVGRVTPELTLALAAHPGIFVVGDICAFVQDGKPLPGVAQVAMQQGARAGRNIRRAIQGQGLEPFRYHDYGIMATIGRGSAVGDVFGLKISGFFAWLFWIFLHIFWLIGFRNRFVVMTEWAWAYFSLQRRVRLITGERDAGPSPARR